jgi:hypothetical protein
MTSLPCSSGGTEDSISFPDGPSATAAARSFHANRAAGNAVTRVGTCLKVQV